MSESSEVESWKDIQEMIDAFKSDEHIGVVGNRILYDDGTVFSAGIDFIMAKNPTKQLNQANAWNWGTASRYVGSFAVE
jgi:GT2 family glycosyltransferase